MISSCNLGCSYWLEFVYTRILSRRHYVHSNEPVGESQRRNVIFTCFVGDAETLEFSVVIRVEYDLHAVVQGDDTLVREAAIHVRYLQFTVNNYNDEEYRTVLVGYVRR